MNTSDRSREDAVGSLVGTVALLLLLALICGGEWAFTRLFCEAPLWGGAKIGWTCAP